MEIIAAFTAGILVSIGLWLLLDRNLVRVVLGVVVLGNGVNIAVLTAGRFGSEVAAFASTAGAPDIASNPLPQALVLTAIVIGFALFVFALAVLKQTWEVHATTATDRVTEVAEEDAPDLGAEHATKPASAHKVKLR